MILKPMCKTQVKVKGEVSGVLQLNFRTLYKMFHIYRNFSPSPLEGGSAGD